MSNMYLLERSSPIRCKPEQIFGILSDVTHWNTWTKSIIDIQLVKGDDHTVDSKIKVLQPKLPPAIWTITERSENKQLTWEKKSFGLKMTANHIIDDSTGVSAVKLQVIYRGLFASIAYMLTRQLTEKYLQMEITGLKERCENSLL